MAEITGTTDNDTLVGTPGADIIHGLAGNDSIDGGAGADQMDGGPGDDTYFVDDAGDTIVEAQGDGFDNVASSVSYHLNAGAWVEILSTTNHAGTDNINLTGNEIAQILLGNAGNNVLNGGGGADTLTGFGGNDTYFVDADDVVREDAGGGFDYVVASGTYTLNFGAEIELLGTTDNAGTAAIDLTGNNFAQVIIGNAGMNSLRGGPGGGDVLVGFGGDDTYFVDADDQVREDVGGGFDYVVTTTSYALNFGAEIELLGTTDNAGTDAIDLTGNNFAQVIIGNAGKNSLRGGPGGGDVLVGFGGDDTYFVDADDQVREDAGGGFDYVVASSDYALNFGAEIELLGTVDNNGLGNFTLTGNNFTQIIIGNAGDNVLNGGGGGADILNGLAGNDTLFVDADDIVREEVGNGYDYVVVKSSYALNAGAEIELMTTTDNAGTSAFNLTGNEFANIIQGNAGANVLDGGLGNDRLVGLGGADTFAFTTALTIGFEQNFDTLPDFTVGEDKILLGGDAGEPFAALASGALSASAFRLGSDFENVGAMIIYNSKTGQLSYDADGIGSGFSKLIAILPTGLGLTATDFIVSGPANHAPLLTSGTTATVTENSGPFTIVYQATASDADDDRIFYTLGGADADRFSVDVFGNVHLLASPDFETKSSYSFTITANDSGSSSAAQAVTLTVTDIDETPHTPIIAEAPGTNDSFPAAQEVYWQEFVVAQNPNLANQSLASATIQGSISSGADKDYFKISLEAGQLLIIDVDGTTGGLDTVLRLYAPNTTELGDNDDLGDPDPGSGIQFGHNTDSFIQFRAGNAGTYFFSIESFEGGSAGNYQINLSVDRHATADAIAQMDVDALLSGASWNHNALTYGFPTLASQYPDSFSEPDQDFAPFSLAQQGATRQLLQLVSNISSLTFQENGAAPGNADLRYAMSSAPDTAYAYYPTNAGPSSLGGTAWFNLVDFNNPIRGNYAWVSILHETGHALGLKHGHEFPLAISGNHDSLEYSVMTYRAYPGASITEGYTNETFGFPQTLMMYDIAALQKMYGANFAFNSGDTIYSWNPATGEMSLNGVGQGAPGANRVFMTIWDGGGNDTYDLSAFSDTSTIDLRPGEWTRTSAAQTANLGEGRIARGNVANALLFNGDTHSLIENAIGGSGINFLVANQAANHLTGNGGNDTFVWKSAGDVGTGALADTIMDFTHGTDKIDLSGIDVVPSTPNQSEDFHFIGTDAFNHVVGELRYEVTGGTAHLFGDFDGNGIADFEIIVNNITTLTGADFML